MPAPKAASETKRKRIIRRDSTRLKILEQSRTRLLCAAVVFALSFSAIAVRLVEVAVIFPASVGTERTADKRESSSDYVPLKYSLNRGDIVDRNGVVLATNLATESLFANPRLIRNPEEVAEKLAHVLPGVHAAQIRDALKEDKSFVYIKRHLTPQELHAVINLGVPGLDFEPDERRVYPYGQMLSHALGYVNVDGVGLAGIERYFDKMLRDRSKNYDALSLSLDLRVQHLLHEEMTKAVKDYQAVGATGIVAEIDSGEILALSSLPDFDPHNPAVSKGEQTFNRAIQGVYEMGSTFKTFTVAMALEYGIVGLNDGYDASHPIKVARFTITDSHPENRWLSVPEIFAYSSNIGTVKMILDVGTTRQKVFLKKLGLFKPVELESMEAAAPLIPSPWHDINTMTVSYGHGISVTPLHLVQAFATLMGDGRFQTLTMVKNGNMTRPKGERVIGEETVRYMRRLLRMVVEFGTGKKGEAPGYRVGGKTGTAEKVKSGGYNTKDKLASFIAVFPVEKPRYVVLVMIDEPRGNKSTYGFATGGWIAAPVVKRVIERMAPMYGIRPIYEVPEDEENKFWVDNANRKFLHAASY